MPLSVCPVLGKLVTSAVTKAQHRRLTALVGGRGLVLQQRQRPVQAEVEPVAVPVPLPF